MPIFLDKLTATITFGFVGLALTVSQAPSVLAEGHASLTASQVDALVRRLLAPNFLIHISNNLHGDILKC